MQVSAPMTVTILQKAFLPQDHTTLYWLGSGGVLLNSRGSVLMIDPVISVAEHDPMWSEAGRRLLVPSPIVPEQVPCLDAVLYTHADYDHMAKPSAVALQHCAGACWGTSRSLEELAAFGVAREKLNACVTGKAFAVGDLRITPTPASHNWKREAPYQDGDCCGFLIETADGTVWAPGDSVLLEAHLGMQDVDVMLFDFSDDPYHFGLENAVKLANSLPDTALLLYHYGTYDAPDKPAFNADPACLEGRIVHPERIVHAAPGEPFVLSK